MMPYQCTGCVAATSLQQDRTLEGQEKKTMTSLKRWRQIGQGRFHKWDSPGDELEGTWQGSHEGRFGPLGMVEATEGLVSFPLHAALLQRLRHVRIGAEVLLRYTGPQTSKAGRLFKGFEVFVSGNDDVVNVESVTQRES
jgi:hypothetical protein